MTKNSETFYEDDDRQPLPLCSAFFCVNCTNLLSVNLDISDVVLEHRRDVDFGKLVFTENNEKTRFPTRSIPDDHQLLPNGCHLCVETGGEFLQEAVTSRHFVKASK